MAKGTEKSAEVETLTPRVLQHSLPNPSPNAQASAALAAAPSRTPEVEAAISRRAAILAAGYKPRAKNIIEADRGLLPVTKEVAKSSARVEVVGLARLALVMRDIAYWHLAGDIPNGIKAISADLTAPAKLLNHVRGLDYMKELLPISFTQRSGNVSQLVRKTRYDSVSHSTWTRAAKAAFLLADARSGVVVGYRQLSEAPETEYDVDLLWQPTPKNGTGYVTGICAPFNIICPVSYEGSKALGEGLYGATRSEPNADTSLRLLLRDQIELLFGHWYGGEDLTYEESTSIRGQQPSGLLTKPRVLRAPTAPGATSETERSRFELAMERQLEGQSDLLSTRLAACLSEMTTLAPSKWACPPGDVLRNALLLGRAAIRVMARDWTASAPAGGLAAEAIALAQEAATVIGIGDDGNPRWFPSGADDDKGMPMPTNEQPLPLGLDLRTVVIADDDGVEDHSAPSAA